MDVFINWKKDFVGKEATLKALNEGVSQKLVTMVIDTNGMGVAHDEAILKDGVPVGYVSSGGYAHHVGKSMAMGYVAAEFAAAGTTLKLKFWATSICRGWLDQFTTATASICVPNLHERRGHQWNNDGNVVLCTRR